MMPQTLTRLERLAAALTRVRPRVRVNALVCTHRRRVFEPLATTSTSLVQLARVLEQRVLLEVIAFLEADRADVADKRTIVRVRADVVLVVGRVSKDLTTHFARPLVLGAGCTGRQRQRLHRRDTRPGGRCAVKCRVHVKVLLAGETACTTAAREHRLAGRRRRHLGC